MNGREIIKTSNADTIHRIQSDLNALDWNSYLLTLPLGSEDADRIEFHDSENQRGICYFTETGLFWLRPGPYTCVVSKKEMDHLLDGWLESQ